MRLKCPWIHETCLSCRKSQLRKLWRFWNESVMRIVRLWVLTSDTVVQIGWLFLSYQCLLQQWDQESWWTALPGNFSFQSFEMLKNSPTSAHKPLKLSTWVLEFSPINGYEPAWCINSSRSRVHCTNIKDIGTPVLIYTYGTDYLYCCPMNMILLIPNGFRSLAHWICH